MNDRSHNLYLELGLLVFLSFLWGSSFTFIKVAVDTIPPATIVLGRLLIGSTLLLAIVKFKKVPIPTFPRLWVAFTVQGLLQSALPFTLISWGEKHIDSGLAGLLNTTPPLFAFLITYFILRERDAPVRKFFGVTLGIIGVMVTIGPNILNDGASESVWGQLAITAASLSYAVAAIYARRFSSQPVLITATCSMIMATLMMIPVSVIYDAPWALNPSGEALGSVIILGVFSTSLAMLIYFRLVKTLGTVSVTSGSYLRAGFSVLLGVYFLQESITPSLVGGIILILLSVAVVTGQINWPPQQKQKSSL